MKSVLVLMSTKYKPHDMYSWIVEYTNLGLDIYIKDELFNKISQEAPRGVLDWNQVGEAWNVAFKELTGK